MIARTLALLVVSALAAGCGADDPPPPESRTTTSAPSLAGTYGRTLSRADIERTEHLRGESVTGQAKPRPGPLRLALERGTLAMTDVRQGVTIRQDFSATSDGAFRIGAYQAPDHGAFCGPDVPQTASYSWRRSNDVLTLEAVQDECADRDSTLSGQWRHR